MANEFCFTETAQQLFGKTTEYGFSIKWEDLPQNVKTYIQENPGQVGLRVVGGVVFFAPTLITGPLLGLLGFTAAGPAAGSIAAGWQALISPVAARGLFATLQSAAMGGYGAPITCGIVRVVAALSFAAWTRNGTKTVDGSSETRNDTDSGTAMSTCELEDHDSYYKPTSGGSIS